MMKQATKARAGPTNIAIVGAGGIGSALTHLLVRSLHDGELVRKIGGTSIALFDSDVVEQRNTLFQLFCHQDVGKKKVECLKDSLSEFEGDLLEIQAIPEDVRSPGDLADQDLVLVCVDSSLGRSATHSSGSEWADLRCSGDGFIALDHRVERETLELLTAEQEPASCQLEGAIESGNLQMGYAAAAAWGAQWAIQTLRKTLGEENAQPPRPGSSSITFGHLGFLPLKEDD